MSLYPHIAMAEHRNPGPSRYDCTACRRVQPRTHRGAMLCGWEREHWPAEGPLREESRKRLRIAGCATVPTVCPGYSRTMPRIAEVARLLTWFAKGGLRKGEHPAPIEDLIEIGHAAMNAAESYHIEQTRRDAEERHGRRQ